MCNTITDKLTQQLTEQVTISRKRKPGESFNSPVVKKTKTITPTKMFSNTLTNCVKMFCGECDQVVNVSNLRRHLRRDHDKTIAEYRTAYGDPQTQIIQMVYHTCVLCRRAVVLDYDILLHHLRLEHSTNLAKYGSQHMAEEDSALFLQYDSEDKSEDNTSLFGESGDKVLQEQPTRNLLQGSMKLEGTRITAVRRGSSPVPTSTQSNLSLSPETRITKVRRTRSSINSFSTRTSTITEQLNKRGYI